MTLPISKKRILFTSLLVAIGLLAASCGSSSDNTVPEITEPGTDIADSDNPETSATPTIPSSTTDPESPTPPRTQPVPDLPTATAISAGRYHTCALIKDSTIRCWGDNNSGQLGNSTGGEEGNLEPVQVLGISDATTVTTGGLHSCALHEDGTISCWGNNRSGQLGNGTGGSDEDRSFVPIQVLGITDATAITTGGYHSCALLEDGTISCWGDNFYGQLGNGTGGEDDVSLVPVQVRGITDATAITTGSWHSCALHEDGTISCWGRNEYGQLGNGTDKSSLVPVQVLGITDATTITTSYYHSCALHQDATISCWGNNWDGQLGNGTNTDSFVPVQVWGITDATVITAGSWHSCALHQDGTISCWGWSSGTRLGTALVRKDIYRSFVPVQILGITDATAITSGSWHSCALHQDGTISCWGWNNYGQLGNGTGGNDGERNLEPVGVISISDAIAITTGNLHSCALHEDGTISCWGSNWDRQLGNGTGGNEGDLTFVPGGVLGITDATAITADWGHSCALHEDGTISCWGSNNYGQLGNGTRNRSFVPVQVLGIADATAITADWGHSCALHEDGTISCWGDNSSGELGNGTGGNDEDRSLVPIQVLGITDATTITTGGSHSCALHQDGTISCWGRNEYGQLGNGAGGNDEDGSLLPVEVLGITDATAITTGYAHSCALHEDGTISCWGRNRFGELGNGTDDEDRSLMPVGVQGISDAIAITTGVANSCALHEGGTISCWGSNSYGQLGNGTGDGERSLIPVEVLDITDATAITTSYVHSCALHEDGNISCWGSNKYGQLGDGRDPRVPNLVVGFGG